MTYNVREREVHKYLGALLDLSDTQPESLNDASPIPLEDHVPCASRDSVLTAFAQLGALRLNASRGILSLIDDSKQYVLAEATRSISLKDSTQTGSDELWLGATVRLRNQAVCEHVLNLPTQESRGPGSAATPSELIINDLQQDERFSSAPYVIRQPSHRFYAGVPIKSPTGVKIGVYSIYGDQPRDGLDAADRQFLHDMSKTVMRYLGLCRIRTDHGRKEQMLRGLGSFVQGMSNLGIYHAEDASEAPEEHSHNIEHNVETPKIQSPQVERSGYVGLEAAGSSENNRREESSFQVQRDLSNSNISSQDTSSQEQVVAPGNEPVHNGQLAPRKSMAPNTKIPKPGVTLQPKGAKKLFSRAANVLRQASELSGVIFLDASLVARSESKKANLNMGKVQPPATGHNSTGSGSKSTSFSSSESDSPASGSEEDETESHGSQTCAVLGFSVGHGTGAREDTPLPQFTNHDLRSLVRRHPKGRIFNYDAAGAFTFTDASGSDSTKPTPVSHRQGAGDDQWKSRYSKDIFPSILKVARGARSVGILPLWSYEQERWSALAICWTTTDTRVLSRQRDLLFLRIFGNSLMNGLARLEAALSEKAKTSFLSSISHELRSPLHGILGGSEFLIDTSVDGFQADMISSIQQCGRTLLDTVDNILDFAKVNDFMASRPKKLGARRHRHGQNKGPGPRYNNSSLVGNVDLSIVTEEVVEAVFAGQSLRILERGWDAASEDDKISETSVSSYTLEAMATEPKVVRKRIRVVLDMSRSQHWVVKVQPGAWRRIVMNLVGNALKFTEEGFVTITLQAEETPNDPSLCKIRLVVTDSGRGISKRYLQSKLFTPFSQENSFAAGTGLGLSIVRQLVDQMSGNIDVKSEEGVGTQMKVTLVAPKGGQTADSAARAKRERLDKIAEQLRHKKLCVLSRPLHDGDNPTPAGNGEVHYGEALASVLRDWLEVDVIYAEQWKPLLAHIVFCPEPSFDNLALMQEAESQKDVPQVIMVCLDAIEAAALREDARIKNSFKPVEVITQPLGPYKLARSLEQCLKRLENMAQKLSGSSAPLENIVPIDTDERARVSERHDDGPSHEPESPQLGNNNPNIASRPALSDQAQPQKSSSSLHDDTKEPPPPIIIADDNPINLKLLQAFLRKRNLSHLTATNGREAVDHYTAAPPGSIKYVLMDLSMPVLDGMSATRQIRQIEKGEGRPEVMVIALTGLASATAQIEARKSGVNHYLTKPVNFKELQGLLGV